MRQSAFEPIKICTGGYFFNSIQYIAELSIAALVLTGCNTVNPYYNPDKPHHTASGFKNNDANKIDEPLSELLRWQYKRARDGLPKPPQTPTPAVKPDLAFIQANTKAPAMQPAITWAGHATMLVQADGLNVLTDPVLSDRASPVQFVGPKRAQPPGLSIDQLPRIDVVLISHNPSDHLDKNSVEALSKKALSPTLFIVPLGVKAWFTDLGITNVKELDWWDSVNVNGI